MAIQEENYNPALKYGATRNADSVEIADGSMVVGDSNGVAEAQAVSHRVVYAGEHTWTGGGASDTITVSGALASDVVVCTIQSVPSEAAYIASAAVTANTITVTLSAANTSNDGVIAYQVLRAV